MPAVWRIMTHHDAPERAARWCRRNGRIALGWGCTGDLRTLAATGPADMTHAILAGWPDSHNATVRWTLVRCKNDVDLEDV